jgi:hypothetical protein
MLSSVLRSERAVLVNIEIMRAFVRLRRILSSNVELARKLNELEAKYDTQFKVVFDTIRELMTAPRSSPRRRIGFVTSDACAWRESGRGRSDAIAGQRQEAHGAMAKVIWTEPALSDLDAIADYIALDKPSAAQELVRRVFAHVEQLAAHPLSGTKPPELRKPKRR